jgi:hypothetical protein
MKITITLPTYHDMVDFAIYFKASKSARGAHWEGKRDPNMAIMEGSLFAEIFQKLRMQPEDVEITCATKEDFANGGKHGLTLKNKRMEEIDFDTFVTVFSTYIPSGTGHGIK